LATFWLGSAKKIVTHWLSTTEDNIQHQTSNFKTTANIQCPKSKQWSQKSEIIIANCLLALFPIVLNFEV
jgi:hypothetical protein